MLNIGKLHVLSLLLVLLVFPGCQGHQEHKIVTPGTSGNNPSNHIQKQLDSNLEVNAKVAAPSGIDQLNTYLVTAWKFDEEQIQLLEDLCIGESKIIQKDSFDEHHTFYRTADGREMMTDWSKMGANIHFQTPEFSPYIRQLLFNYVRPGEARYNFNHLSRLRNQDLPFMSCSQAVDEVKEKLAFLGMGEIYEEEVYGLNYHSLQAEEKLQKEKGSLTDPRDGSITLKEQWSEKDDCYYMVLHCGIDGIPIYPDDHGIVENNTVVCGTSIAVCYSLRGFEYLSIYSPYQETSVDQANLNILDVEEALSAVAKKYENIIISDPTTITDGELYYVPTLVQRSRDSYKMVPAWCFTVEKIINKNEKPYTYYDQIIIDAATGGEIL